MFYSKSTSGFYSSDIHGDNMPSDVVEVSNAQHQALLDGQSQGKRIVADDAGYPMLQDPPAPMPQYKTQFDSLDFIDLFTEAEQLAIVSATMQSAEVKLWYDKMLGANYVSIEDARTIAGLDALVSAGLITAARQAEILTPQLVQA